jgi:hypothetical protein
MRSLSVSANRRFLIHNDGSPFFYLADTAWELFHRMNRPDAERYLRDRAAKKFTVIQAVALAEEDGLNTPSVLGHRPLDDNDPARPNEDYFAHVDWIIDTAASLGLFMGMLPTWGDKWNKAWGVGPEIFNPDNAFAYGRFLGRRYRDKPMIWILGGDRIVETAAHRQTICRMAEGIREGDGGRHLMTFHPQGGRSSSEYFAKDSWLDFNMLQTGHARNSANYDRVAADYALSDPVKPVIDAEPGYEDHPAGFRLDNGYLDDYDVRKSIYWSLFAGACGHTYGSHPIWQFWRHGQPPKSFCRTHWEEALHLPGSGQLRHARALIESRPVFSRVPDQALIVSENPVGNSYHNRATRDADGRYAFVYCPYYLPVVIDLSRLRGESFNAHWFDPRTGTSIAIGSYQPAQHSFQPPHGGPDWVLVIDDAAAGFGRPGVA